MDISLGPLTLLAQISTLRFPPAPLNAGHYRAVFNKLSTMETFNFTMAGDGVEMVTPPGESGETMRVGLGRDSVTVSFDPTSKSADYAAEQLTAILKEIASVLPIPVFVHQTHILRKTIPLSGGADARSFLSEQVLCVPAERMAGWTRPPAGIGIRFVFPPQQNELSNHDLKIESFLGDQRKIFVEDSATFLVPLPAGQWDQLKAHLAEANRFLDEHARALLIRPTS